MLSFEGLPLSLDVLEDGPASRRPGTLQGAFEMMPTSTPDRVDTGFALRQAQDYQSQRPSETQPPGLDFSNQGQAGDAVTPTEEASTAQALGPRLNEGEQNSLCHSPTPVIRPAPIKPSFKGRRFRIGYENLLTNLLLIDLSLSILVVMCVCGNFGQFGFLLAGIFPIVLVAAILSIIITRVVNKS